MLRAMLFRPVVRALLCCAPLLWACDDGGGDGPPVRVDGGDEPPVSFDLTLYDDAPLTPALLGVWGTPSASWVVGGTTADDGGYLARLADGEVVPEPIPPVPQLWWIWGAGPDRLWACGEQGRILARRDGAWTEEPTGLDEKAVLWGIWGSSPTDLWAVGGSIRNGGPRGVVLRSTGDGIWRRVDDSALPADLNLYKVWGAGPDDVHIVGEGGAALHYDGVRFTRHDVGVRDILFTVHGRAGGPVLAVGGLARGLVYRWTGDGWVADGPSGAPSLNGVFVRADGSALVSGARGTLFFRTAGGAWQRLEGPSAVGARTLHAVWAEPDLLAVGGDLVALTDGVIVTGRAAEAP